MQHPSGCQWAPVGLLLLLWLFVGDFGVPVEEDLGSDEAVAEGGDHKDASHEVVSGFLVVRGN